MKRPPDECPRCKMFFDECECGYMRNQLWISHPDTQYDEDGLEIENEDKNF